MSNLILFIFVVVIGITIYIEYNKYNYIIEAPSTQEATIQDSNVKKYSGGDVRLESLPFPADRLF